MAVRVAVLVEEPEAALEGERLVDGVRELDAAAVLVVEGATEGEDEWEEAVEGEAEGGGAGLGIRDGEGLSLGCEVRLLEGVGVLLEDGVGSSTQLGSQPKPEPSTVIVTERSPRLPSVDDKTTKNNCP